MEKLEIYSKTYTIRALFERPIYISRAELAFVDDLIARIRKIQSYAMHEKVESEEETGS